MPTVGPPALRAVPSASQQQNPMVDVPAPSNFLAHFDGRERTFDAGTKSVPMSSGPMRSLSVPGVLFGGAHAHRPALLPADHDQYQPARLLSALVLGSRPHQHPAFFQQGGGGAGPPAQPIIMAAPFGHAGGRLDGGAWGPAAAGGPGGPGGAGTAPASFYISSGNYGGMITSREEGGMMISHGTMGGAGPRGPRASSRSASAIRTMAVPISGQSFVHPPHGLLSSHILLKGAPPQLKTTKPPVSLPQFAMRRRSVSPIVVEAGGVAPPPPGGGSSSSGSCTNAAAFGDHLTPRDDFVGRGAGAGGVLGGAVFEPVARGRRSGGRGGEQESQRGRGSSSLVYYDNYEDEDPQPADHTVGVASSAGKVLIAAQQYSQSENAKRSASRLAPSSSNRSDTSPQFGITGAADEDFPTRRAVPRPRPRSATPPSQTLVRPGYHLDDQLHSPLVPTRAVAGGLKPANSFPPLHLYPAADPPTPTPDNSFLSAGTTPFAGGGEAGGEAAHSRSRGAPSRDRKGGSDGLLLRLQIDDAKNVPDHSFAEVSFASRRWRGIGVKTTNPLPIVSDVSEESEEQQFVHIVVRRGMTDDDRAGFEW